ncbi:acyltransferase [bacterium]|nr:acyltransferase [bacterium]
MKAIEEIGISKGFKFAFWTIISCILSISLFPPIRIALLRLFGAKIGKNTIIHDVKFFNLYRRGFSGLKVGDSCFIGEQCLFDLADEITIGDYVTIAERITVITHVNVGYKDHPLQKYFSPSSSPVTIQDGSFIGAGATILSGVEIGKESFIAAGSVVNKSIPKRTLAGGVPAKLIRNIE